MIINENKSEYRIKKIFTVLLIIFFALMAFSYSVLNTISKKRNIPSLNTSKMDLAVRGDIISSDTFKIATSKKIYTTAIDIRFLDLDKLDLFVKLFSIYSDTNENKLKKIIEKSFKNKKHYLILNRKISSRQAKNLKLLSYKLMRLKVFKSKKINGARVLKGLDVYETGETRLYPYKDTLTPVIGYIRRKNNKHNKQRVNGEKGIENYYNYELNNLSNGILKGERDISSYIIFNKNSKIQTSKNGQTLELNIPLKLQKNIEMILDKYKNKLGAKEIIACVIETKTGKVLTLASSNRFNPSAIKKNEISNLNVNAIEQTFEPGSVIKPISIALALDKNRVNVSELFFAYNKSKKNGQGLYKNGRIKIGRWYINDDHQFKKHYLTIKDIIIFSSNIGALQIAQRLKGKEILDGFSKFGLSTKTGIDLPYEKIGSMPSIYQLSAGEKDNRDNIFKATVSYGQGMRSSFMQILTAYTVFNNDGYIVSPSIVKNSFTNKSTRVISRKTASIIKKLLIATVQEGTGSNTIIKGLEIGGKTGTANKVLAKIYISKYMSSFFGFANDKNSKYTVGVSVNEPISTGEYWYYYYASNSAVPVFREIIKAMIKLNYLAPNLDKIQKKFKD